MSKIVLTIEFELGDPATDIGYTIKGVRGQSVAQVATETLAAMDLVMGNISRNLSINMPETSRSLH